MKCFLSLRGGACAGVFRVRRTYVEEAISPVRDADRRRGDDVDRIIYKGTLVLGFGACGVRNPPMQYPPRAFASCMRRPPVPSFPQTAPTTSPVP
jgi:hypothetical protein